MKTDLRIRTYLADLANHSSAYTLCHSGSTWMYHIIHNLSSIQIPEASLGYGQNRVIGESLTENFLIFQNFFYTFGIPLIDWDNNKCLFPGNQIFD